MPESELDVAKYAKREVREDMLYDLMKKRLEEALPRLLKPLSEGNQQLLYSLMLMATDPDLSVAEKNQAIIGARNRFPALDDLITIILEDMEQQSNPGNN